MVYLVIWIIGIILGTVTTIGSIPLPFRSYWFYWSCVSIRPNCGINWLGERKSFSKGTWICRIGNRNGGISMFFLQGRILVSCHCAYFPSVFTGGNLSPVGYAEKKELRISQYLDNYT